MRNTLENIIEEDLSLLRRHRDIGSKLGSFIDAGSYGFVVEYLDNSPEEKVIKILDPKYVECSFQSSHPQIHSSLLPQSTRDVHREWDNAQRIGYTKSPHLMPLLTGPKRIEVNGRSISFLVMPRLQTIEDLKPSGNREQQIVSILCDCCSGLQVLHRQPEIVGGRKNGMDALVHADIKPNNIFCKPGNPPCYMLGDYSIVQRIPDLENRGLSIASPENPYCAPGPLGKTSDIYSLGWVLYYWMNNKQHPTQEEVADRQSASLSCPSSWGDNPELWNVFLKMTKPNPAHRYQNAEEVKAALQEALRKREARLAETTAMQRHEEGKTEGQVEAAGLILIISAAYHLLKWIFGSDPVPSDGEGRLHGSIKKNIPYLGGKFQGTWEHGIPKEGTYTSPTGKKQSGQWVVHESFREPFMETAEQTFTGLSLLEKGRDISWQGVIEIRWPWGTSFKADMEAGNFANGVLTYSDGRELKRKFGYRIDPKGFSGVLCDEKKGNVSGCGSICFDLQQNIFAECEWTDNVPGPGTVFLPGSVTIPHTAPTYEQVMDLLVIMRNSGGRFVGTWDHQGFPRKGTYTFRSKQTAAGDFTFALNKVYPNGTYTGMVGDDDLPWGIGTGKFNSGHTFTGEFFEGAPQKK